MNGVRSPSITTANPGASSPNAAVAGAASRSARQDWPAPHGIDTCPLRPQKEELSHPAIDPRQPELAVGPGFGRRTSCGADRVRRSHSSQYLSRTDLEGRSCGDAPHPTALCNVGVARDRTSGRKWGTASSRAARAVHQGHRLTRRDCSPGTRRRQTGRSRR
jgi:hypothetical protein